MDMPSVHTRKKRVIVLDTETTGLLPYVRRASTLVSVRVNDSEAEVTRAIINDNAPVDVDARRASYREEGWEGFNETTPEYTDEDVVKERDRLRQSSQLMP